LKDIPPYQLQNLSTFPTHHVTFQTRPESMQQTCYKLLISQRFDCHILRTSNSEYVLYNHAMSIFKFLLYSTFMYSYSCKILSAPSRLLEFGKLAKHKIWKRKFKKGSTSDPTRELF
jgi:hypothetical protein